MVLIKTTFYLLDDVTGTENFQSGDWKKIIRAIFIVMLQYVNKP